MFLTTKLLFHGLIIRKDWWAKFVKPVNMKYDAKQIQKRLWFVILYRLMCRKVNLNICNNFIISSIIVYSIQEVKVLF